MSTVPPRDPVDLNGVRRAYDTVAEDYANRLPDTRAEAPQDLAMVDTFAEAALAADAPGVLDAGCGAGRMARYLADRGCDVTGIDLSPGMIAMARRDHPDLGFAVGSLTDLPYAEHQFAGVMLWYSIIHTPPEGLARIFGEVRRVLRPAGLVLVACQSGTGTRDLSEAYRRSGHDVRLERHLHTADRLASQLSALGVDEVRRMVRPAQGSERDEQAVLLARARSA